MNLLLALTRKILLPACIVLGATAIYRSTQGQDVDYSNIIETTGFLSLFVVATWAPLPLVQRISSKFKQPWQSPIRLITAITFVAIIWTVLLLILSKFGVLG
jgi:hypothetical protein